MGVLLLKLMPILMLILIPIRILTLTLFIGGDAPSISALPVRLSFGPSMHTYDNKDDHGMHEREASK